jgi:hypothetical protein
MILLSCDVCEPCEPPFCYLVVFYSRGYSGDSDIPGKRAVPRLQHQPQKVSRRPGSLAAVPLSCDFDSLTFDGRHLLQHCDQSNLQSFSCNCVIPIQRAKLNLLPSPRKSKTYPITKRRRITCPNPPARATRPVAY